ncbi:hypothetical protein [Actinotalea solisilvae]|uniref:hypothetical protein n=1 Tax=Actinotalea solisilvae TaxID=2072922 RepID=UPI0018F1F0E6|nr:hypothetical protein [Actinotalea solisilvae]
MPAPAPAPHPAAAEVPARRRRLPRWATVVIGVVVALLALLVGAVVWFLAMLSGGLDDLLGPRGPSAEDARVVEAREEHAGLLVAALEDVVAGRTVIASTDDSSCQEGQHNWKIDDPFDLRCTQREVALVEGGDPDGFRADMEALDAALVAAGWEADWSSMDEVLTSYWDQRDEILDHNPGWGYPARMPSAGYVRDGVGLSVSWVQPGQDSAVGTEFRDEVRWTLASGERVPPSVLPSRLADGRYATALSVSGTYFEG